MHLNARRLAPLAALLIAGCALGPLGGSPTSDAAPPTSSQIISTSPPAEASGAPPGCGVTAIYDYMDPKGAETPDEAFEAYKADILAQKPVDATDATDATIRAALVTALAIATAQDKTGRLVRYEARSGDTLVGVITVTALPPDNNRYLVTETWVAVPEALCSAAEGGH